MSSRALSLVALASLAAGAAAEQELPPLVVTAMPLSHDAREISGPVGVLSGTELAHRRRASLGETLAREPGVSASDFGQGSSRPIIRGLGGPRLRMLQDGVGAMDASSLSPDHAVAIEPFDASQVEILRGPATLLYGSGAIGGVVNVVSGRVPTTVPEAFSGLLDLRLDSVNGGGTGQYAFEGGAERFAARVTGLVRRAGDYAPGDGGSPLANSDLATGQFAGGLSYVGERGMLGLGLASLRGDYGIPGEGVRIDLEQLRQDVEARLQGPLPGLEEARLRIGRNDYEHREIEDDGSVGTVFSNREVEGRLELLHAPLGDWRGLVGLQLQARDFSALGAEAYVPAVDNRNVGLFLLEERDWGPVHLELGARVEHDWNAASGGNPDTDRTVYGLSGGAVWTFAPGYSLGATLSRAQRAPSIEELYSDGPHHATGAYEIGDPRLGEETANNLDVSLRKFEGAWTWTLNAYANRYQDYVYQRSRDQDGDGLPDQADADGTFPPPAGTDETFTLLDTVQGDAWFHGLELETGLALYRGPAGEFDGRLMLDYVRGELDGRDGNLPRITPLRFGGALDWKRGPWAASVSALRVERQDRVALLETETPGHTLLDVSLDYTFGAELGLAVLSLRAENLLDELARRHESFIKDRAPLPGRNVGLDLRLSF